MPALADRMRRPPIDALRPRDPFIWLIEANTTDVSSTAIRHRIAQGESISGLVPPAVQQHIEQHGLYTSKIPDRRAR
jgi:nicotinic acid mononucleotide adenylyltransferase